MGRRDGVTLRLSQKNKKIYTYYLIPVAKEKMVQGTLEKKHALFGILEDVILLDRLVARCPFNSVSPTLQA